MASKTNTNRKRIMRSVILTASMLSLIPLVGVMQSTASKTDSNVVAAVTSAAKPLTASPVSYETAPAAGTTPAAATASSDSKATTQPATTASATTAQQTKTATQTTTASSYTRTKAS